MCVESSRCLAQMTMRFNCADELSRQVGLSAERFNCFLRSCHKYQKTIREFSATHYMPSILQYVHARSVLQTLTDRQIFASENNLIVESKLEKHDDVEAKTNHLGYQ